jgi:anti-sigma regulatory factor (Ser/Thr protein kinase)
MAEREHLVAAYDEPGALAACVASFVAESLENGVPVVTISRPTHRRAVDDVLAGMGVDPVGANRSGALITLDADETMSEFMVEGRPDPARFAAVVASMVPTDGGPVGAFGEMVALLWERGEVAAALELETLWNTAIVAHPLRLLCAYPGELLSGSRLSDVARACDLHDHVSLIGAHPGAGEIPRRSDAALSSIHLPVPAAVSSVRHFVRDALTAWDLHALVGDVTLVTSELATNAITHGGSPFRTSLTRVDGVVRIAVEDRSRAWPERHHARPGDQDGRGMAIVATLSQRSGCESTPGGKVAWAELTI